MIRFVTLFCAVMAAGSGFFLYTKKHETLLLDQSIRKTVEDTRHIQQQTAMLRTQWALLNQPDRLSVLARRVLPELSQVDPAQFVQLAALRERLPAIDHRIIAMPPAREQAQRHLAALASQPAPAPVARPARDGRSNTRHGSRPATQQGGQNEAATRSLEQSLALLGEPEGSTPGHHRHHGGDTSHRKQGHPAADHKHGSTMEDVVWHPSPTRQETRHDHASGINTASAPADARSPLPAPVPLTD